RDEFHPVYVFPQENLPERIARDVASLHARMTWCDDEPDRGRVTATLAAVSDVEVRRLAQLIVDIAAMCESELQRVACEMAVESHERAKTAAAVEGMVG
ncbi:MAG: hypothetical protein ACLP1X_10995, partial [Polyangiaceae bacterium]